MKTLHNTLMLLGLLGLVCTIETTCIDFNALKPCPDRDACFSASILNEKGNQYAVPTAYDKYYVNPTSSLGNGEYSTSGFQDGDKPNCDFFCSMLYKTENGQNMPLKQTGKTIKDKNDRPDWNRCVCK
jgi:hypothetical protein